MGWHDHLEKLPNKGEFTVGSGIATFLTTLNGFVGYVQPIVSFMIAAIAGYFTIQVGILARDEKRRKKIYDLEEQKRKKELHDLDVERQKLEILNLKADYNDKT